MNETEEIVVLFHAALLGRTDVVQNALTSLRKTLPSNIDVANAISVGTNTILSTVIPSYKFISLYRST